MGDGSFARPGVYQTARVTAYARLTFEILPAAAALAGGAQQNNRSAAAFKA